MRSAGDKGRSERRPAVAMVPSVCGPQGISRPSGAVLFSDGPPQAKQTGSSDPRGRRNIKTTLIYTRTAISYPVVFCPWLGHPLCRLPDLATWRGRPQFPVRYPVTGRARIDQGGHCANPGICLAGKCPRAVEPDSAGRRDGRGAVRHAGGPGPSLAGGNYTASGVFPQDGPAAGRGGADPPGCRDPPGQSQPSNGGAQDQPPEPLCAPGSTTSKRRRTISNGSPAASVRFLLNLRIMSPFAHVEYVRDKSCLVGPSLQPPVKGFADMCQYIGPCQLCPLRPACCYLPTASFPFGGSGYQLPAGSCESIKSTDLPSALSSVKNH